MYRLLDMFNSFYDYSAGTLWQTREDLLKERVAHYDQDSDRFCHPVLSIRRVPISDSLESIPMLVGLSKRSGGRIAVRNVFPGNDDSRRTFFGNTVAPLSMHDFIDSPDDENKKKLTGNPLHSKRVVINHHKPRIDADEHKQLIKWMSKKGF